MTHINDIYIHYVHILIIFSLFRTINDIDDVFFVCEEINDSGIARKRCGEFGLDGGTIT